MISKNITRTFTRSDITMTKYIETMQKRKNENYNENPFLNYTDILVKEFKYWVILENEFPYDAIATTSHMIVTKREVAFDWSLLNKDELAEFYKIKNSYIKETYDVLYENLPKGITAPGHFHLHLLILKREEF